MTRFQLRLLATCSLLPILAACSSGTVAPEETPSVITSVTPTTVTPTTTGGTGTTGTGTTGTGGTGSSGGTGGTGGTAPGTTTSSGLTYATLVSITDPSALVSVVEQNSGSQVASVNANSRFNGNSNQITASGSTLTETASSLTAGLSYVGALDAGSDSKFFLVPTQASDMPTGSATYTGLANVVVPVAANSANDGVYAGQMESTVTVTFDPTSTSSNLALSNLSGAQVTTTAGPVAQIYTSNGTESISIDNLSVSGTTLTNTATSSLSVTGFGSAGATPPTNGAAVSVAGAFAGPAAAELAGAAGATGSTVGGTSVIFTGKK